MPVSPHDQKIIDGLQPEFGKAVYLWLNDCAAEHLPVILAEGLRSFERSNVLYAQGRTKPGSIVSNAKAGQSYHNFGIAVDCVKRDAHGDPTWDFDPASPEWKRVVALAKARGMQWGGDWKFRDVPHFQPAAVPPLVECRRKWPKGWSPKGGPT